MPAPDEALSSLAKPPEGRPLRIALTCYPTMGGSGVIATELGLALAERGHQVHMVCADVPERLRAHVNEKKESQRPGLLFHQVPVEEYLLPNMGSYPLALAVCLAQITREQGLDIWHLHYGVPHAVSAFLGQALLSHPTASAMPDGVPFSSQMRPLARSVVTLHGTDVTGVGQRPSLREIHRFSLMACDALTVPSQFLQQAAYDLLQLPRELPISVIPNFVNTEVFAPAGPRSGSSAAARPFTLCHASNFRPLKRIEDVIAIFAAVKRQTARSVRLLLIGEGPERPRMEALVTSLGLSGDVQFRGAQPTLTASLHESDVFLLPSQSESFGLAALEALSSGVPVVASRVGGLPEVIAEGDEETGFLFPVGDVAGMAGGILILIADPQRHARMAQRARRAVLARFQRPQRVADYEALYRRILATSRDQSAA